MDKLSALSMFVATAEHGSFSRAAEQLGKTPSALTKAVGHLEDELGSRLFERSTRRLALTEAGNLYLETARQVLECLREAGEEIDQLQHNLTGNLRLTAPLAFGPAFLNEASAAFLVAHPQLKLHVSLSDTYVDLLDSGFDLALREGRGDIPGMIVRPLAHNRSVLCASPAYLARCGTPSTPAQLLEHQALLYQHAALDQRWRFSRGAEQLMVTPQGRLSSDNHDLLLAACLAGQGLMDGPLWSLQPLLGCGQLVQLLADYELEPDAFGPQILALYPSHRRATRKVQAFIEFMGDFLRARQLA
jgi:DNA-binding transcriptional LysR family regulator